MNCICVVFISRVSRFFQAIFFLSANCEIAQNLYNSSMLLFLKNFYWFDFDSNIENNDCLFLNTISYNTSHKFWDQSPFPHYQSCLQVSETVPWHKVQCCYSVNILQHLVGGWWLIYFCKVDHSRISRNFSRNWVGLNNLCEILSQNLRMLGK